MKRFQTISIVVVLICLFAVASQSVYGLYWTGPRIPGTPSGPRGPRGKGLPPGEYPRPPLKVIRFALVADPQLTSHNLAGPYEKQIKSVKAVVSKIKEIHARNPLKGCVLLGDLTWNHSFVYFDEGDYNPWGGWWLTSKSFNKIREYFEYPAKFGQKGKQGKIGIPTYIGLGNHDIQESWSEGSYHIGDKVGEENIWEYVKDRFTDGGSLPKIRVSRFDDKKDGNDRFSGAYSWDWRDINGRRVHLVQLHLCGGDTHKWADGKPHPSNLPWLKDDLEGIPSGTPVMIFQHYHWNRGSSEWREALLHDVIKDTKANVIAAFHGHTHPHNYRYTRDHRGLPYYDEHLKNYSQDPNGEKVPIFHIGSAGDWKEGYGRQFSIVNVDLASKEFNVIYHSLDRMVSQPITQNANGEFVTHPERSYSGTIQPDAPKFDIRVRANGAYVVRFCVGYANQKKCSGKITWKNQKRIAMQLSASQRGGIVSVRVEALYGFPIKWREIGKYTVPPGTHCYQTTGTGFNPGCKKVNCN